VVGVGEVPAPVPVLGEALMLAGLVAPILTRLDALGAGAGGENVE
jgi:hypothetical protein